MLVPQVKALRQAVVNIDSGGLSNIENPGMAMDAVRAEAAALKELISAAMLDLDRLVEDVG